MSPSLMPANVGMELWRMARIAIAEVPKDVRGIYVAILKHANSHQAQSATTPATRAVRNVDLHLPPKYAECQPMPHVIPRNTVPEIPRLVPPMPQLMTAPLVVTA